MSKYPILSARKVVNAMIRLGFHVDHQKGSHIVLKNNDRVKTIVIPNHDELDRGTLKAILKQSEIEIEELLSVLVLL